ncbi:MAG: hypothetical protein EBQ83_02530 [Burkholderiaceae bacterium]|nr:hypothetical protein [Burkholderiaceae bacterium]
MPKTFVGIILANEVLDALPCEVIMLQQGRWFFQGVGVVAEQLQWSTGGQCLRTCYPTTYKILLTFLKATPRKFIPNQMIGLVLSPAIYKLAYF